MVCQGRPATYSNNCNIATKSTERGGRGEWIGQSKDKQYLSTELEDVLANFMTL